MRERPILFSAPMVRAILEGRKTQTRRVVKAPASGARAAGVITSSTDATSDGQWHWLDSPDLMEAGVLGGPFRCPYGHPSDRLWVRETWMPGYEHSADDEEGPRVSLLYRADNAERSVPAPSYELAEQWSRDYCEDGDPPPPWKPSIHMPRWASRITLQVTGVRVDRLHAITEADAVAEGASTPGPFAVSHFMDLWTSINGAQSWNANPWVWVVEFRRVTT